MQNFLSNLTPNRGGAEGGGAPDNGVPWWMKYVTKMAAILAGGAAIFFGLWCCIGFSVLCIVAGLWQMVTGFLIIVVEAPFCCMCLDYVQQIAAAAEGRPVWQKGVLYLGLALPPLFVCPQLSTFLGCGAIFGVATLYGMQTMGKKGSQADMAAMAQGGQMSDDAAIIDSDQQYGQQYP